MAIRTLVTRGFGAGGAIRLVVTRGFSAGAASSLGLIELRAIVSIAPAVQVAALDLRPALAATAEVTPALRGSIVIH